MVRMINKQATGAMVVALLAISMAASIYALSPRNTWPVDIDDEVTWTIGINVVFDMPGEFWCAIDDIMNAQLMASNYTTEPTFNSKDIYNHLVSVLPNSWHLKAKIVNMSNEDMSGSSPFTLDAIHAELKIKENTATTYVDAGTYAKSFLAKYDQAMEQIIADLDITLPPSMNGTFPFWLPFNTSVIADNVSAYLPITLWMIPKELFMSMIPIDLEAGFGLSPFVPTGFSYEAIYDQMANLTVLEALFPTSGLVSTYGTWDNFTSAFGFSNIVMNNNTMSLDWDAFDWTYRPLQTGWSWYANASSILGTNESNINDYRQSLRGNLAWGYWQNSSSWSWYSNASTMLDDLNNDANQLATAFRAQYTGNLSWGRWYNSTYSTNYPNATALLDDAYNPIMLATMQMYDNESWGNYTSVYQYNQWQRYQNATDYLNDLKVDYYKDRIDAYGDPNCGYFDNWTWWSNASTILSARQSYYDALYNELRNNDTYYGGSQDWGYYDSGYWIWHSNASAILLPAWLNYTAPSDMRGNASWGYWYDWVFTHWAQYHSGLNAIQLEAWVGNTSAGYWYDSRSFQYFSNVQNTFDVRWNKIQILDNNMNSNTSWGHYVPIYSTQWSYYANATAILNPLYANYSALQSMISGNSSWQYLVTSSSWSWYSNASSFWNAYYNTYQTLSDDMRGNLSWGRYYDYSSWNIYSPKDFWQTSDLWNEMVNHERWGYSFTYPGPTLSEMIQDSLTYFFDVSGMEDVLGLTMGINETKVHLGFGFSNQGILNLFNITAVMGGAINGEPFKVSFELICLGGQVPSITYQYHNVNDVPEAGFTYNPLTPNTTTSINFTDTSEDPDGRVFHWNWNFDDGTTSTVRNPTHTFASAGTYHVVLQVWDYENATDTYTETIVVSVAGAPNYKPVANFVFSPSNPNITTTIQFTDSSVDSDGIVVGWSWHFGDGSSSTFQNPTHQYTEPGTYWVELEVTDNLGATGSVSKEVSVTDIPNTPPVADFTYNPTSALNTKTDIQFTDASTDSDGQITYWDWDFGDGTSSNVKNPIHRYMAPGNYTVELVAIDDDFGTDTAVEFNITVVWGPNDLPIASIGHTPAVPLRNVTVFFSDKSVDPDGSIVSRAWDFDDGNTSWLRNPAHKYTVAGIYNVTLTVVDDRGGIKVTSVLIDVNIAPVSQFSVVVGGQTSGMSVEFAEACTDSDGSIATWMWNFGDGTSSTARNPVHVYAQPGTYVVSLTVADEHGATNTYSTSVTVRATSTTPTFMDIMITYGPYMLIAAAGIVVVAAVSASRKKKLKVQSGKQAVGKKAPGSAREKKLPEYKGEIAAPAPKKQAGGYTEASVKAAAPVSPAAAKFYCSACNQYYDIQAAALDQWYTCPTCHAMLNLIKTCPSCTQQISFAKADYDKFKGQAIKCPHCSGDLRL